MRLVPRRVFAATAIWGSSAADIYAVGVSNTILHSVGNGSWTLQAGPSNLVSYSSVWGSGPNDIFVAGNNTGSLQHSIGDGAWIPEDPPMSAPASVWGTGPNDVYVVGDNIIHKAF